MRRPIFFIIPILLVVIYCLSVKGASRVILTGLKKYGMIVADNGSDWFITGATDSGWDDEDLNQLKTVPGNAFEVVQTGAIIK